ncbi:MAG TPA: hypothetical protein VGS79_05425 [Puia sp.]|nr:hypothetical protein [Puia sp.]
MSEEMILAVLNEALEELQTANKSLKDMGQKMEALEARVRAFEAKEIRIEPPNLEPLKGKIDELPVVMDRFLVAQSTALRQETAAGLLKVAAAVEAQPKPIVRRISFFPENDREGNYKTFIRWLIGGIVGAMLVGSAYVLANEWIQRTQPPPFPADTAMKMSVDTSSVAKPPVVPVRKPRKHTRER